MNVTDIEAIPLSHDLADGRSFGSARGRATARVATLVRIEIDDGTVGWGEAFAPPRTVATLVDEVLADQVLGMDPYDVQTLVERSHTGQLTGYHFGGSPFVQCALSGIDIALWDVLGKTTDQPIHRLLGGRRRAVVPYASTGYITEWDEDINEPAKRAAEEGFTAAKIKIGRGVESDVERVGAVRRHLGDDAHLMVDYNGNYDPKRVIQSVRALEPYDVAWIEEPVPPENYSGYRQLKHHIEIPIAAGEAHFNRFEFKRLIDKRLVDVVQPNVARVGGFSEGRFIADLAVTENVAVRPHVWNSAVGLVAALQLLASVPDYPHSYSSPDPALFEYDRSENPLRDELLVDPLDPTGGELAVPREPGLGIAVDETAVERYRIDN